MGMETERPGMLLENDRISIDTILCATSVFIGSGSNIVSKSEFIYKYEVGEESCFFYAVLDGSFNEDYLARPAILVRRRHASIYRRVNYGALYCVHTGTLPNINPKIAMNTRMKNGTWTQAS